MKEKWILYDKDDDYIQECESEKEVRELLEDMTSEGGLSTNLSVVKVVQAFEVKLQLIPISK